MLLTKQAIKRCYIFPHYLINAFALPCETENTEIVYFHVNVSCWFANRQTSHIRIVTVRLLFIHKTIGWRRAVPAVGPTLSTPVRKLNSSG